MGGPTTSQLSFATDDMLAAQLRQVRDGLHHLSYEVPRLAREVEAVLAELDPSATHKPTT